MPAITGTSHVALTVTDLDRSVAWYQDTLGWVQAFRGRSDAYSFETAYLTDPATGMLFGLIRHDATTGGAFDVRRVGLDHLAFAVESRDALEEWAKHLAAKGVANGGVEDQPFGAGLTFADPDGIALEFYHFVPPAS